MIQNFVERVKIRHVFNIRFTGVGDGV